MYLYKKYDLPKPEPDFKRVLTTFKHIEPDRVPLVELGVDKAIIERFIGRPISEVNDYVEFSVNAGYDYLMTGVFSRNNIGMDDNNLKIQLKKWSEGKKGIINSWDDYKTFPWPSPDDIKLSHIKAYIKSVPEDMGIILEANTLFVAAYLLMGFESLCISTIEEPELPKAIIDKVANVILAQIKRGFEYSRISAFWLCDDIAFSSGLMVKPEFYRVHVFPWYKEIGDLCRQKGIPLLFHSDGNYKEVIDDLLALGVNAINPVEQKSMDIACIKKLYSGRLSLIGNIDIDYTLTEGTIREVEDEVKKRIRDIAPGGGYCIGSSNSITPYVKFENYLAMIRTALKYGDYPVCM